MSFKPLIKVNDLSKAYAIYRHPRERILQVLLGKRRKLYREHWALQRLSFEAARGETIGVIGRNGSGKSTLLQLICGTLAQTTGSVECSGKIAALLELGTGFNPEFTGRENIHLSCALHGIDLRENPTKIDKIIEFSEIADYIDQPVKTYSSGMFVRLAFSVIAHVDADLLVIDEALSVGDAFFSQKCMRFLREFVNNNGTIFFVSHDSAAVAALCDRVLWLDKGTLMMDGRPKDVLAHYLASLYSPPDEIRQREPFKLEKSFGNGGATILETRLLMKDRKAIHLVQGLEKVTIEVSCEIHQPMQQIIIGFLIKNKRGQVILGTNSGEKYVNYSVKPKDHIRASFEFEMPTLEPGEYVISAALAEGTQMSHIQHHWIHDALIFTSRPVVTCHGIVGIASLDVQLETLKPSPSCEVSLSTNGN